MLHRELQTILRFLENCSSNNSCWSRHIAARTSAKETQRRRQDLRERCHDGDGKVRDAARNWDSHSRETEGKKKTARSTRVLSLAPQNTPHTPRSTAKRTPQNANEDPRGPRGPWACLGHPLAFGTCFWHLGHALTLGILFQF